MTTTELTIPTAPRVASGRARHFGARGLCVAVVLAAALAASILMLNGARWLLHESPRAANELVVATCALEVIYGRVCVGNACNPVDGTGSQRPVSGSEPRRGSAGGALLVVPNSQTLASS